MLDLPAYLKLSDSAKEFHNALIALLKKYDAKVHLWIYQNFDENTKVKDGVCLALVKNWFYTLTSSSKDNNENIKEFVTEFNKGIPKKYDVAQIMLNNFAGNYRNNLKNSHSKKDELNKCNKSISCLTLLNNVINPCLTNYSDKAVVMSGYKRMKLGCDIFPNLPDDFKHDIDNLKDEKESLMKLSDKVNKFIETSNKRRTQLEKQYDSYVEDMNRWLYCLYNFGNYKPKYLDIGSPEENLCFVINNKTVYSEIGKVLINNKTDLQNYIGVVRAQLFEGVNNCYFIRMVDLYKNEKNDIAHAIGLYAIRSKISNDAKKTHALNKIYMLDANTGLIEFDCSNDSGDIFLNFFLEYILHLNCLSKDNQMYPSRIYIYAKQV